MLDPIMESWYLMTWNLNLKKGWVGGVGDGGVRQLIDIRGSHFRRHAVFLS